MIQFTVIGTPIPQGSKTKWGTEDNPRTRPWRATIAAQAAAAAYEGLEPPDAQRLRHGPVQLVVRFYFPRPKAHYRTGRHAGELKPNAPDLHAGRPDLDKLVRAAGDALTGTILGDDAQIALLEATKLYGEPARAEIEIRAV